MLIKRDQVASFMVPKQTVEVPEFGGEVVVRCMPMAARAQMIVGSKNQQPMQHIVQTLAVCVIDAAGEPIFSAEEWDAFGGAHFNRACELYLLAQKLSGADHEENQKN